MRFLAIIYVLVFVATSNVRAAQNSTAILQAAQKQLPKCALNCMISTISKSSCEPSDFYCISHNQKLNLQMASCVQTTCTIREALIAKNFTETAYATPVRDHSRMVSYTGMIGGGFAVLAVLLRIIARIPCCGGTWGWDDWVMVITMLPVLPLTALSVPLANYGLGKDIWTVPFDNITAILHIYYFDESLYLASIALTKVSILLFYLRIFPNQAFRRLVYGTLALCILYIVGFIPAVIVQCSPIRIAWQRWDGEHYGKCINLNVEGWVSSAFNIIFDIITICLPLHELSKLAMGRRKKAGIMLMFLGGGFVTVVSILRLKWMIQFANSQNATWDYTPIGYWSTLEVHIGIIFACLPAIRSLEHRIFPKSQPPNSYSPSPSGAYGYNSKGGSPFPSIARQGKHAELGSHASMMRSRNRTTDDKDFIQLDEYESQLGEGMPAIKRDDDLGRMGEEEDVQCTHFFRGLNHTQVQHGSVYTEDEAMLLPIPEAQEPPTADFPSSNSVNKKGDDGWNQGIKVTKDYSVTVEVSPDPTTPKFNEERVTEKLEKTASEQPSHRETETDVRNFSRQRLKE